MNTKRVTKVIAAILAFMLTFANVFLLASNSSEIYAATVDALEEQKTAVAKAKVEFDAYFKEGEEKKHAKAVDIEKNSAILYLSLKVQEGYIENASVKIEGANFKVQESNEEFNIIQDISSEENKITLNQIRAGESAILEIPIKIDAGSNFDVSFLNKTADVVLEGAYVNEKGKEVKIEKKIQVRTIVDGEAQAELEADISKYVTYAVNENKGVILQMSLTSKLANNKLPVKSEKLEIEIPKINNIEPKEITLSAKSLMASKGITSKTFEENKDYKIENRTNNIRNKK